jgi:(1->4)-alpha-D-glucan 1-alpha-D-glucosylmutase
LALVALKLTVPGVPDIYQETETWSFSLVDPDNRRAVDFGALAHWLDGVDGTPSEDITHPARKLRLTAALLELRRRQPLLFERGSYEPLEVDGPAGEHVVAYARVRGHPACMAVCSRLPKTRERLEIGWRDTRIALPSHLAGAWRDVVTGKRVQLDAASLQLDDVLGRREPVAVLERADE